MNEIAVGSIVSRDGQAWRVTELTEAAGGETLAQIESLDRDAFAAVALDRLELLELTPEEVEERIADREKRMMPLRVASMRRAFRKQIARAEDAGSADRAAFLRGELRKFEDGLEKAGVR